MKSKAEIIKQNLQADIEALDWTVDGKATQGQLNLLLDLMEKALRGCNVPPDYVALHRRRILHFLFGTTQAEELSRRQVLALVGYFIGRDYGLGRLAIDNMRALLEVVKAEENEK